MFEIREQHYGPKVLVSGWTNNLAALPFDNRKPTLIQSHYKFLGISSKSYIPKSTAQEAMEQVKFHLTNFKPVHRSSINFTSFRTINDHLEDKRNSTQLTYHEEPISTYARDYKSHFIIKKTCCPDVDFTKTLINRCPKNEFTLAGPSAPGKFMDSHFYDLSANRKFINQCRQIRNVSNIF